MCAMTFTVELFSEPQRNEAIPHNGSRKEEAGERSMEEKGAVMVFLL